MTDIMSDWRKKIILNPVSGLDKKSESRGIFSTLSSNGTSEWRNLFFLVYQCTCSSKQVQANTLHPLYQFCAPRKLTSYTSCNFVVLLALYHFQVLYVEKYCVNTVCAVFSILGDIQFLGCL